MPKSLLTKQLLKQHRSQLGKKFYLEVHDFGYLLPGLDDILRLKEIYPNFKITCFTIPFPQEFFDKDNKKHFKVDKYKEWAQIINSYDWLEVAVHGFSHSPYEMDVPYDKAIMTIDAFENLFKEVGLKYKKIFVAPYWQYSYDAFVALRDRGYVIGMDRNYPRPVPQGVKTFIYNWSYEEPVLSARQKIVGHGHTTPRGVRNGLSQCYLNILNKIPNDAPFGFISEYVKEEEEYEKNQQEDRAGRKGGGN